MVLWPAMADGEMFVWLLFEAAAKSGGRRAAAKVFMEGIIAKPPATICKVKGPEAVSEAQVQIHKLYNCSSNNTDMTTISV